MKRHSASNSSPGSKIPFCDILSSLKYFNRDEITQVRNESNRLLSLECSKLASYIPEEVWKLIFTSSFNSFLERYKQNRLNLEDTFRLVGCVSRNWNHMVGELVQEYFKSDYPHSNWILKQFDSLTSLSLLEYDCCKEIGDEGISNLTKLTTLTLDLNPSVTDISFKKLTNLTSLKVTCYSQQPRVSDDCISHLTLLQDLSLHYNSTISDRSLKNMANLTILDLSCNNMISDECISRLTNLTNLDLYYNCCISDRGLSCLVNLKVLKLSSNEIITNESVKCLTNLMKLRLCDCDQISNAGIMNLFKLTYLENNTKVGDKGLRKLTNLRTLRLQPYNCIVTDNVLKTLTNLTKLAINFDEVLTDASLSCLTNLTNLFVAGTSEDSHISDASIMRHSTRQS